MKLVYPAIFIPVEGHYQAVFPDLPGCTAEAGTLADTICQAQDAAAIWILRELDARHPLPPATQMSQLVPADGSVASLIVLDMDSYGAKYGPRTVRKNLTIPAWLNAFAEKKGINFSRVLTDALTELYLHQ